MTQDKEMKLWGGRFTKQPEEWVDEFSASIPFDQKLADEDVTGSIAHATMLGKCGIISLEEADKIIAGLRILQEKAKKGELVYTVQNEDIHLNMEKFLHDEIGETAGKLHTARSRNDQVATDAHLYLKNQSEEILELIQTLQSVLLDLAKKHVYTIIPGYTHLQRAQPVSLAHHFLAYFWMLERDKERLSDAMKRVCMSPLGAGALAGTTFPIDRHFVMEQLGFTSVYEHSLDAVSDRDFMLEFHSHASIIMMHLSRLSEELIMWCSEEFQFIEFDDTYSTGSSIMPQKKNPDMAELVRGKTGRVYGNLMAMLTVMKGLPLAYNKDLQEDKEGLFDTVETMKGCLSIMAGMLKTMTIHEAVLKEKVENDFSTATELADYLAVKGLPFREAHEVVGKIVLYAIQNKMLLRDIPLEKYQEMHPSFDTDLYEIITPYAAVNRRNSYGGTGFDAVQAALKKAEATLQHS